MSGRRPLESATAEPAPCSRRPERLPRRWARSAAQRTGPRVRRLLGGQGERLADEAATWLESLPPAIIRHEPWLELAVARRARAEGRWTDALDAYGRAEAGFGASAIALVCHRERQSLHAWFEPVTQGQTTDWTRLLRSGVVREPLGVARDASRQETVPPALVRGLLALAGRRGRGCPT